MNKGQPLLGRRRKHPPLLPEDLLTNGHWERKGAIRVWVKHECEDCGQHLPPHHRCDTCLTWAVKNARDHTWAQISQQNRGQLWDILALRNEMETAA